ncbi:MAG: PriCT-2 domain-containing protein [Magnetococcales bacterium]|nr:PriCT-2 domain-containing protein [Magnetococcales bacterium]
MSKAPENGRVVPDRAVAERYLNRLDPEADSWTFQTFFDEKGKKNPSVTGILIGNLDEHWPELVHRNQNGAGVFVTVNRTNGKGRKKTDIDSIRSLWQEDDRGDTPRLPTEPHMEVESSPGKYHRYILINGGPTDEFEPVQQRLVDDYGSDPNAKDRSRVLRLPGFYHMKNPDKPHMVRIVSTTDSAPLSWEKAKEIFPPVSAPVKPTNTAQSKQRGFRHSRASSGGALIDNPAELASAVFSLDPDMGYNEWLSIGMGLHDAYRGHPEGLKIWIEWSQSGVLFNPGECEYRWSTFGQLGNPVTKNTIFKKAYDAGWDGSYNLENDIAFNLIEEEKKRKLMTFNRRHAVTMIEGKGVIVYRENDAATDVMTTRFSDRGSIGMRYSNRMLPIAKEKDNGDRSVKLEPIVSHWMEWRGRNEFDQVVFSPTAGLIAGATDLPHKASVLNLYQGLAFQPAPGNCDLILNHIMEIWCAGNQELFDYVIKWLARMFQFPGERGHTALVLHSGEGTGKNIVIDILVRAFGDHAFVASQPDHLVGRFNDHLGRAVLVFANEAVWGGDKQQEGALKQLITDEKMAVERKYIPTYHTKNCAHVIIASNNDWVAPMGMDDRRFVVMDVSEQRKGDWEYFQALADQIDAGGDSAFIHHLLNLDINGFNPRALPTVNSQTKYINKIKTANSVTQWFFSCLERGSINSDSEHPLDDGATISKDTAHRAYLDWCESMRINHRETLASMTKTIKKLVDVRQVQQRHDGNRVRVYEFPPLAACRQQVEQLMGHGINWDD